MTQTIEQRLNILVNPSRRKLTLFGCSCAREIWHLLEDERSKQAIIAAEKYADGLISKKEMKKAVSAAYASAAYASAACASAACDVAAAPWVAYYAAANYDSWATANATSCAAYYAAEGASNQQKVIARQNELFDDIFGS